MKTWMALFSVLMLGWPLAAGADATPESSSKVTLSVWGGYGTVSMSKLNTFSTDFANFLKASTNATVTQTKLMSTIPYGLEGVCMFSPNWGAALRVGYMISNEGKVEVSSPAGSGTYSTVATALPVELGVRYLSPVNDQWTLGGGVFLGDAFGSVGIKRSGTGVTTTTDTYTASGFGAEAVVSAAYRLSSLLSLGLNVGYRMMATGDLKASAADAVVGIAKGDTIQDTFNGGNANANLDFSGLTAVLALDFHL